MEIKTINRCPKCQSEHIMYVLDIFKSPTDKKYYTGECECKKCNHKFNRKDIIKKKWIAVDDLLGWIKKECINEWENCGGALENAIKKALKKLRGKTK